MEKYKLPERIVASYKTYRETDLLNRVYKQHIFYNYVNKNDIPKFTIIEKDGFILVDFGCELSGGVTIRVRPTINVKGKMRVVFGESVAEALSELGEKNSGNWDSIRDLTTDAPFHGTFTHGNTGFRFLTIRAVDEDLEVASVEAFSDVEDFEYKGHFECNDERLNKIWQVGAYTVKLNMHEYIWDGVKRDRLVWIGDMHPETSTIGAVFGDVECVAKSLDLIRDITPKTEWMNGMTSYSMWWIVIHYDYFMQWGKLDYLKEQEDTLLNTVKNVQDWIDGGLERVRDDYYFIEWPSRNTDSEAEGIKAMLIIGLEKARILLEFLGYIEEANSCLVYIGRLRNDAPKCDVNKRMSALNYLADRGNLSEAFEGSSTEGLSCFMGYYVLLAKAKKGDIKDALEIIRNYWGAMIDMGATTFWEDFDVEWTKDAVGIDCLPVDGKKSIHGDFGKYCYTGLRGSLCHGWASGPTPFLSKIIGGIEILEPGCKKVRISPDLGDLEWVKIAYPTPYGNLNICAKKYGNETKVEVNAPKEIEIV